MAKARPRILLAVDLDPHSDRAIERTAVIARAFDCDVSALSVICAVDSAPGSTGWTRAASDDAAMDVTRKELEADLEGIAASVTVRVVRGMVAGAITAVADAEQSDLVVVGAGGNRSSGRVALGATARALAGTLRSPLLVVRNRAVRTYRSILVATDFSPGAAQALRATLDLFPEQEIHLFHAREALDSPAAVPEAIPIWFRLASVTEREQRRLRVVVKEGRAAIAAANHVRAQRVGLAVFGALGRSAGPGARIGGIAEQLLETLPSDVMVVRGRHA
jgi:nucleotide-binding universal stress UspA family protein